MDAFVDEKLADPAEGSVADAALALRHLRKRLAAERETLRAAATAPLAAAPDLARVDRAYEECAVKVSTKPRKRRLLLWGAVAWAVATVTAALALRKLAAPLGAMPGTGLYQTLHPPWAWLTAAAASGLLLAALLGARLLSVTKAIRRFVGHRERRGSLRELLDALSRGPDASLRSYYGSRFRRACDIWVYRTLLAAHKHVEDRLRRLEELQVLLEAHAEHARRELLAVEAPGDMRFADGILRRSLVTAQQLPRLARQRRRPRETADLVAAYCRAERPFARWKEALPLTDLDAVIAAAEPFHAEVLRESILVQPDLSPAALARLRRFFCDFGQRLDFPLDFAGALFCDEDDVERALGAEVIAGAPVAELVRHELDAAGAGAWRLRAVDGPGHRVLLLKLVTGIARAAIRWPADEPASPPILGVAHEPAARGQALHRGGDRRVRPAPHQRRGGALAAQQGGLRRPSVVLAAAVLLALYGLGSLVDLVAAANAPPGTSPHESFVERLLLERFIAQLLPLREKPLSAAPIHVGAALCMYLVTASVCCWIGRLRALRPEGEHRFWRRVYHLCGYGPLASNGAKETARRWARNIEPRFVDWLRPLVIAGPLLLLVAFFELHYEDPATPPLRPFLFGVCVALYGAALVNLLASRCEEPAEEEQPAAEEPPPPPDPLAWLEALRGRGFVVSTTPSLRVAPPVADAPAAPPPREPHVGSALRAELARRILGDGPLWPHQQQLLARIIESRAHQLVVTPPRSGKTAALQLLCAHTAVVDGRNALVVLRDAETAEEACARFAELLAGTSWRENLRCTLAGPPVTRLLAERRSPMITFADPDTLEGLVLNHDECRYFLEHLGLHRLRGHRAPLRRARGEPGLRRPAPRRRARGPRRTPGAAGDPRRAGAGLRALRGDAARRRPRGHRR